MKKQKIVRLAFRRFILLSALSLLWVSVITFASPQAIMDLVRVQLLEIDAFSSIRGVYGNGGLTLLISLLYLMQLNLLQDLVFLCWLRGFYAFSRLFTIYT